MRKLCEAKQAALAEIARSGVTDDIALIESAMEAFEEGWVFYYQSADFLASGDMDRMLVGAAPVFVPRGGEAPQFISYHRPTSESVEAFRCCGDANAPANAEVELLGFMPGSGKVSATQAIRARTSLGLASAKAAVDSCLAGRSTRVGTSGVPAAHALVCDLSRCGFLARVTFGA